MEYIGQCFHFNEDAKETMKNKAKYGLKMV